MQYITDDGKKFSAFEDAQRHELSLGSIGDFRQRAEQFVQATNPEMKPAAKTRTINLIVGFLQWDEFDGADAVAQEEAELTPEEQLEAELA